MFGRNSGSHQARPAYRFGLTVVVALLLGVFSMLMPSSGLANGAATTPTVYDAGSPYVGQVPDVSAGIGAERCEMLDPRVASSTGSQPNHPKRFAAKGVDGGVDLYRHVSPGELADIGKNGFRPGPNSLGGKWFAESGEHASQWGRVLNNGDGAVVKVRVPGSFADQLMRLEKLDGIGPARYVEPHQLDMLNRFGRGVW